MDDLSALKSRTRAALNLARARVIADARGIVAAKGPTAIIVTHLAKKHAVSPLTVRRWLLSCGFDLSHLVRGRPSFSRLAAIESSNDGENG